VEELALTEPADIVIVMEHVHIQSSTVKCRLPSVLVWHHQDTRSTRLDNIHSHRGTAHQLRPIILDHLKHFPHINLLFNGRIANVICSLEMGWEAGYLLHFLALGWHTGHSR
jgi:hypothetical protein